MKKRKMTDSEFWFDFDTDDEGCLTALFWTDGQARVDYDCFGDVVIFDSTYKVNRYNMPFIPFLGVNHHGQTIVFGCVIVANESWESYQWVLSKFLESHYQKFPKSIITDGCLSMAKAIGVVLPHVTHRMCSWHTELAMFRNLSESSFEAFRALVYRSSDPEDFDNKWEKFCKISKSSTDEKASRKRKRATIKKGEKDFWLEMMYNSKEKWASGFSWGKLLLGMKSNQRSESFNSTLHRHLDRMMYLTCLVEHYEDCVYSIRRNEAQLDCQNHSTPVLKTSFQDLENHAATTFTHKAFYRIREEINRIEEYEIVSMLDDGMSRQYFLEFKAMPEKQTTVTCVGSDEHVKCSCLKFESELIPCRHILKFLVEMGTNSVPDCCIARRWTKSPKPNLPLQDSGPLFDWTDQMKRTREMVKTVTQFFEEETVSEEGYVQIMELLRQIRLQNKKMNAEGLELDLEVGTSKKNKKPEIDCATDSTFGLLDPKVSVSRGRPKRNKNFLEKPKQCRCSKCGRLGHNKAACTFQSVHQD